MLLVNEQPCPFAAGLRLGELAKKLKPGADVLLLNGAPSSADTLLQDGDTCSLIKTGEIPSALEMEQTLAARHGQSNQHRFRKATVGIMGLGGLGSAVALSLTKIGIGTLILADHDVVVLSNIHRQQYFIDQIGMKKTEALKNTLLRVNPFIALETVDIQLTSQTIPAVFAEADIVAECFDSPAMKADALRTVLREMPDISYIGSSGMAGYGSGNLIRCRRIRSNVYIVGDEQSDVEVRGSLMAPRVGVAAQQQANQVVRLLLGIDEQ